MKQKKRSVITIITALNGLQGGSKKSNDGEFYTGGSQYIYFVT